MSAAASSARVFLCCAAADDELRAQLVAHLAGLERLGTISIWDDTGILPGEEPGAVMRREIQRADVVLLLLSASFLADRGCYDLAVSLALERHERGEAVVIPVLLRPVDWESAPFGKLACLPGNALAVTMWRNQDEAFLEIQRGLARVVEARAQGELPARAPPAAAVQPAQARRLDGAVASSVAVGQPTEVVAMIATAVSGGLRALLRMDPASYTVTPDDVRSSGFDLDFPVDEQGRPRPRAVVVALESPDFDPPVTRRKILVPPAADSPVCTFFARPLRAGPLWLQMDVQIDDVTVGSQRLRTSAGDAGAPLPTSYVVGSVPLSTVAHAAPGGLHRGGFQPPPPPGMGSPGMGPPPAAPGSELPPAMVPAAPPAAPPPPPPPPRRLSMIQPDWLDRLELPAPSPPPAPMRPPPPAPGFAPPPFFGERQSSGVHPPPPLPVGHPGGPPPGHKVNPPQGLPAAASAQLAVAGRRALAGFLVSFRPDPLGVFWPIWEGTNRVGRWRGNLSIEIHVQLPFERVSALHAVIECQQGAAFVINTGSRHGTTVNGVSLQWLVGFRVHDGDEIVFGGYRVRIFFARREGRR